MNELIKMVEKLPGNLQWLLRTTEAGRDRKERGGRYFAHIYGSPMYGNSFDGSGETPEAALTVAFEKARARLAA